MGEGGANIFGYSVYGIDVRFLALNRQKTPVTPTSGREKSSVSGP
jgi:hypothetical protein